MKKTFFELSLLLGLCFSLLTSALALEHQKDISEKLIRLHIVANSNSESDQETKLLVRDGITEYMKALTLNCRSAEEARDLISSHLKEFEDIANNICKQRNAGYLSRAELGNSTFPTKRYNVLTLPAGEYESLNIYLGSGSGENWWCVLFPPLCISAAETKDSLKSANLSNKEIKYITADEATYQFEFKLLEIIQKLKI